MPPRAGSQQQPSRASASTAMKKTTATASPGKKKQQVVLAAGKKQSAAKSSSNIKARSFLKKPAFAMKTGTGGATKKANDKKNKTSGKSKSSTAAKKKKTKKSPVANSGGRQKRLSAYFGAAGSNDTQDERRKKQQSSSGKMMKKTTTMGGDDKPDIEMKDVANNGPSPSSSRSSMSSSSGSVAASSTSDSIFDQSRNPAKTNMPDLMFPATTAAANGTTGGAGPSSSGSASTSSKLLSLNNLNSSSSSTAGFGLLPPAFSPSTSSSAAKKNNAFLANQASSIAMELQEQNQKENNNQTTKSTSLSPANKKTILKARTAYTWFCKLNKDFFAEKYKQNKGIDPPVDLLAKALEAKWDKMMNKEAKKVYENHEKLDEIRYKFEKRDFNERDVYNLLKIAAEDCGNIELTREFLNSVRSLENINATSEDCRQSIAIRVGKQVAKQGGSFPSPSSSNWRKILAQWNIDLDDPASGEFLHQNNNKNSTSSSSKTVEFEVWKPQGEQPRSTQEYRMTIAEKLLAIFNDDRKISRDVEQALFQQHLGDMKEYAASGRSLLYNLRHNEDLRSRVLKKELKPTQLVKLSPRDLATDEQKKQREELEAKSLKNSVTASLPKTKQELYQQQREERGGVARMDLSSQKETQSQGY
ncbi:unnamed protein product [Amoebophrya sp. A120]|nr:unnamed protein product [Amoebophrya sp. A120]|eukprot:GSA120T00007469001.1